VYLPKPIVYSALNSIPNVSVLQGSQKTVVNLPAITFYVTDNDTELNLENEITAQFVQVTVDIWAKNSEIADSLLEQAETKMRALGYRLSFCIDVPDPNNICHINTRFDGTQTN
jgi:hypothetical protein